MLAAACRLLDLGGDRLVAGVEGGVARRLDAERPVEEAAARVGAAREESVDHVGVAELRGAVERRLRPQHPERAERRAARRVGAAAEEEEKSRLDRGLGAAKDLAGLGVAGLGGKLGNGGGGASASRRRRVGSTHGWARQVLEWLNSTWPHPAHALINLGEAGGSLVSALTTCPSTYLNFDVDLALVDLTTTSVPDGERLLRLLLRPRGRPTLPLLTQFHPFVVEERPWRAEKHRAQAPGQPQPLSVTEVGGGDSCVDGRLSNRTKSDVAWDANRRPFLKALSAHAELSRCAT